jgi:hypothetical protein
MRAAKMGRCESQSCSLKSRALKKRDLEAAPENELGQIE